MSIKTLSIPSRQSTTLAELATRVRLSPLANSESREWQDPTTLDQEFGSDPKGLLELLEIAHFFSCRRSENELLGFLDLLQARVTLSSGWIWPILNHLEKIRGTKTVLVLMQCPLRDQRFGMGFFKDSCFTEFFAAGLEYTLDGCGATFLPLDLRKECRRNKTDTHCPRIDTGKERRILGLATVIELLVAKNVYGVKVIASLSFCRAMYATMPLLQFIDSWEQGLVGKIHHVPWHPAALASLRMIGKGFQAKAEMMLREDIIPIIRSIWELSLNSIEHIPSPESFLESLCDWYKAHGQARFRVVFDEQPYTTPPEFIEAYQVLQSISNKALGSKALYQELTSESKAVVKNETVIHFKPQNPAALRLVDEKSIALMISNVNRSIRSLPEDSFILKALREADPDLDMYFRTDMTAADRLDIAVNQAIAYTKAIKMRYKHSDKGKARRAEYEATEEHKALDRKRNKRYRDSAKGKATKAAYMARPEIRAMYNAKMNERRANKRLEKKAEEAAKNAATHKSLRNMLVKKEPASKSD